jgi:hypothetical protein
MRTTPRSSVFSLLGCLAFTGACSDAALDFRSAALEKDEVEIDPWIADVGVVEESGESLGTDESSTDEGSSSGSTDTSGGESTAASSWGSESGTTSVSGSGSATSSATSDASGSDGETGGTGSMSESGGSDESGPGSDSGTDESTTTTSGGEDGSSDDGHTDDGGDAEDDGDTDDVCVPPETSWHCANEDESCECFELEDTPDTEGYFWPDPPLDGTCEMPVLLGDGPGEAPAKTAAITVKYSRGNNDDGELEKQKAAVGVYQYQTAELEVNVKADRSGCACDKEGKVTGDMLLTVNFKASGMSEYWRKSMKNKYFMICGEKPAKATTQVGAMADPGPNLKMYGLSSKIGKVTDGRGVMTAEVTCKLSCEAGDHVNRVYLPPKDAAETTAVIYDPAAETTLVPTSHIDTKVTVTKEGAISVEPRYIEYIVEYPWLAATKPELATVEVVYSLAGGMEKSKKTWQIAKLIHDGTKAVGVAFKKRGF